MSKQIILCIDDEQMILRSLKAQLKKKFGKQYSYEFAESADEGLELIAELTKENYEILVIVSDWLMPGMKGDKFLIEIHKKYPQIVKVMLTGQASEAAIQRAYEEAGLHSCLYKPWSEIDLCNAISTGLCKKP